MPKFSIESLANLAECHPDLQRLYERVIQHWDCKIIDGARTIEEQRRNVAKGVSKTMHSLHLVQSDGKSHAVDATPYPDPSWHAIERAQYALRAADPRMELARFYAFNGFVAGMAAAMGISVRQGCDWDGDRDFSDHSFVDLPHTELKEIP